MNATIEPHIQPESGARAETRAAQARWAQTPIGERLRVIRELRHQIAENAELLANAAGAVSDRPLAEKLVSEVLPLADACRWLERRAARLLAPRRCGKRGRPFWMQGISFEVQRQPFGVVLVIGPGNYPLFLPAVHSLHALVAGNAVILKPAPGTRDVALAFAQLARDAGLNPALLTILAESVETARHAIAEGVDKVIFTGSSGNGRSVLARLAETNTPSVMELSGEDAVLVLADADLDLVVRALRFGTRLNAGETCIAPRRLVLVQSIADDLLARLSAARLPRLPVERVRDDDDAVQSTNTAAFALGASIFSRDLGKARALAARIETGFVLINDLIVPTADPRMPFGGVKASGFGTTRGDEGLLEMTFPHVVGVRRGRRHPHFDEPGVADAHLFTAYLRAAHGRRRFAAIRELLGALLDKTQSRKTL
ncbi:MAG: aldehyde dehydrogenase family protein [Verrucomicrobiota bacterium]|nr:aldehyde dehydrogenase family protein [Verrucomicrobiota bacterium]